jgi:hypothetical protein
MQFALGVTILEWSFAKHNQDILGFYKYYSLVANLAYNNSLKNAKISRKFFLSKKLLYTKNK